MSKGMQQRLGIAQAIVGRPRLLLLDEPTSALDPAGRRTVRRLLEDLRGQGVAVLLNSHLLSEVELVCDRVAIIARGEVVAAGTPDQLSRAGGVEVETSARDAAVRERRPRRRARDRARPGGGRRGRLRGAGPALVARGLLPRGRRGVRVRTVGIIAAFALRESLRRRVFLVVGLLTVAFLVLYGLGTWQLFDSVGEFDEPIEGVDARTVAGATILGLAMFATLFLGTILAVFLTLGAVRGDAERGLLQPILVRPLHRRTVLLGRFAAAASVCGAYVIVVFLCTTVITWAFSDWWPDRLVVPALQLAAAVAILAALSIGGSVLLSSTANGIAVFMLFGAGLVAGLLGQIGEALGSHHAGPRGDYRELGAAVRGALPGGAERAHRRTPSASRGWRSISGRSAAPSRPGRCCGRSRSRTSRPSARSPRPRSHGATCDRTAAG